MQISRLFEIVYILLNRRHTTARELAERFEVSVRTIYRDIDALSQAGVPVYATQGARGGIFISDAYVLNKSALTDAEQGEILVALQSLSAAGHSDTDRLLSRMASLFNKDSTDWIAVDFSRWGNGEHDRRSLAGIKNAILQHRLLSFTYYSGNGVCTQRLVSPIRLLYKSRAWYVQAFCSDRMDYRTFKIVRMTDVRVLEDTFDRAAFPEPPPLESSEKNTEEVTPMPRSPLVVLRFQPGIAWRVLDEFDPSLIHWEDSGMIVVKVHFCPDDWLYSYILSFGMSVEVLEPPFLRKNVRDMLAQMLEKYDTNQT